MQRLTLHRGRPARRAALLAGLALSVFTAAPSQAQTDLTPAFTQGRTATYSFWSSREQSVTMSAAGETESATTMYTFEGELRWSVDRVRADGSADCTMTYDWVAMTIETPDGQTVANDSRRGSGDAAPIHELLKAIAGKPLTVRVEADGTVASISGTQAIRGALSDPAAAPDDDEFLSTARTLAVLPGAPDAAEEGASWRVESELPHEIGRMAYDTTMTLQGVGEMEGVPVATVVVRESLELDPELPELPPGVQATTRLTASESTGTVLFDLDRHETVGRNDRETTTIQVRVSAQGQTFSQTIDETRVSQLLRLTEE